MKKKNYLVGACDHEVEQGDDGTLELRSSAGVDGRRRESLPNDSLTDVRRDEQGNTRSKTIAARQAEVGRWVNTSVGEWVRTTQRGDVTRYDQRSKTMIWHVHVMHAGKKHGQVQTAADTYPPPATGWGLGTRVTVQITASS